MLLGRYNSAMTDYVLLIIMAAVLLGLLLLRTHTAIVFFALCAGQVLMNASGENVGLVATSLTSGMSSSSNIAQVVLLLAPAVACAIILRGHLTAAILPLAFLPAAATALLGALFVTPQLAAGAAVTISATETWSLLSQYQEPVVVIGLVSSIVLIALTIRHPHTRHHKKKH